MTKERMMIFTIAMAVTIAAVFCWYYYEGRGMSHKATEPKTVVNEGIDESETIIDDRIDFAPYKSARYLTVEKVIRTQIEKEDGTVETQYDSYLLSDMDLENGMDETMDYSEASVGEGFEIEKGKQTDFISEFGFDYKQISGDEVYEQLLSTMGIKENLNEVTFDQDTYDKTGQKIYILNQSSDVIDKLMQGVEYDELISSKVFYQVVEDENNSPVPDCFVAFVQYKEEGQIITKNLFLQVTINPEAEVLDEPRE